MFKKATLKDRANIALANLQRNAYALSLLRTRIESKINFILNEKKNVGESQELTKVLDLVKSGEIVLNELSGKIESARFLEEFISIIDNATSSVREIKDDVEQLVPVAEAAIREMHDAIARVSKSLCLPEFGQARTAEEQAIHSEILDEVSAEISKNAEVEKLAAAVAASKAEPKEEIAVAESTNETEEVTA